jgi:hypothetical protein
MVSAAIPLRRGGAAGFRPGSPTLATTAETL